MTLEGLARPLGRDFMEEPENAIVLLGPSTPPAVRGRQSYRDIPIEEESVDKTF